jgi:hypothetical protein
MIMRSATSLLVLLLLAACGDPMMIIPGHALSGQVAAAPDDWTQAAAAKTIQVEFRKDDPYSVNIWCAGLGHDLYIATNPKGTHWTPMLEKDPLVRARIGSTLYELSASAVTDETERSKVADAYAAKYKLDAKDNWVTGAKIFRLDRRS